MGFFSDEKAQSAIEFILITAAGIAFVLVVIFLLRSNLFQQAPETVGNRTQLINQSLNNLNSTSTPTSFIPSPT